MRKFGIITYADNDNICIACGFTYELLSKNKLVEGFTEQYDITNLVYYERFPDAGNAIRREKRLKKYNRKWKTDLIEKANPGWKDLYENLTPLKHGCGMLPVKSGVP